MRQSEQGLCTSRSAWISSLGCALLAAIAPLVGSAATPPLRSVSVGEVVRLVGLVRCEYFPGPPTYGEDPTADVPEVVCFLCLNSPVILLTPSTARLAGEATPRLEVERFQVVVTSSKVWDQIPRKNLTALSQRRVEILGTIELPGTAHHRAPLIVVQEIDFEKGRRKP